jgi:hypothetical protein
MSQLSLFDEPRPKPEQEPSPKEPKPRPKPPTEPRPDEHGPIQVTADVKPSWQCIVIGCAAVTMGAQIEGHPVCDLHDTDRTREVIGTGAWPSWYGYEGEWRIVPTVRRFDNLGHNWSGLGSDGKCNHCAMTYTSWSQNRFDLPCSEYENPDLTKGLFRP